MILEGMAVVGAGGGVGTEKRPSWELSGFNNPFSEGDPAGPPVAPTWPLRYRTQDRGLQL